MGHTIFLKKHVIKKSVQQKPFSITKVLRNLPSKFIDFVQFQALLQLLKSSENNYFLRYVDMKKVK